MTTFLRLLNDKDKAEALYSASQMLRRGETEPRIFEVAPESFKAVPGAPFAYWVSDTILGLFKTLPAFESEGRTAKQGIATADDFRFVRTWWEVKIDSSRWPYFAKGGAFSPFYADIHLVVNWDKNGAEICNFIDLTTGKLKSRPQNTSYYLKSGLTWSDRTTSRLSPRPMPSGVVFSVKGSAGFFPGLELSTLGLMNSTAFDSLISLLVGAGDAAAKSYQVGTIGQVPYPGFDEQIKLKSKRAWSLKRTLDTDDETSHAFLLPVSLLKRWCGFDLQAIEAELARIQAEIDEIAFDLYGFSEADRTAVCQSILNDSSADYDTKEHEEEEVQEELPADHQTSLLSWSAGVAFGRFDWRLATGEREAPSEPDPFDPLPAKSPGMLPDDADPFHAHVGILVDDPGHPHDLAHLIEEVLERVDMSVPNEVRQWLQKDFFAFHLKTYSKSRRKAPIYWPLSTPSASYSVWCYYHQLTRDTFFRVTNDYVTPKVDHEERKLNELRQEAGPDPSSKQRKAIDSQETFVAELRAFKAEVVRIAPMWNPNFNDGVIINFAPLWRLVPQHKPLQKECKKVWDKICKGDYDWAHLAMHLWPERVVPKCGDDRSLAIAHGLEDDFWYEDDESKWQKRQVSGDLITELVAERSSNAVKAALKDLLEAPAPTGGSTRKKRKARS